MALSKDRNTAEIDGVYVQLDLAAGVTVYNGAMVSVDNTGKGRPARATATDSVIGRAERRASAAAGDTRVRVKRGIFGWKNDATDPVTGPGLCYVVDDETVSGDDDSAARPVAGRFCGFGDDGTSTVFVDSRLQA